MAFCFKAFAIADDQCAMKVGTDAVLLGVLAEVSRPGPILDIGCGSGIVALMMAQRFTERAIVGIDIDPPAVAQAQANVAASPWPERIVIKNTSVQCYAQHASQQYAALVCNPPYFRHSLAAPDPQRHQARHDTPLPLATLFAAARQLVLPDGLFTLIFPADDETWLRQCAEQCGWTVVALTRVLTKANKPPRRIVVSLTLSQTPHPPTINTLHLHDGDQYSAAFKRLTRDFYLRH